MYDKSEHAPDDDNVFDYEHHHEHLVEHPLGDDDYLYDPIHHFLIIKPPGYVKHNVNFVDQFDDHIQHYDHDPA